MIAKLIVVGGLAFYAMTWILSFVTGPVVHNGLLLESYQATAAFWRPALMQPPPDMAALLPRSTEKCGPRSPAAAGCAVLAWAVDRWAPAHQ
jgi:hypothetical protein